MTNNSDFSRSLVAVTLALVGGQAVYWFLTPLNHPDASALRSIGVGLQAVFGFGGAIWVASRRRSERA